MKLVDTNVLLYAVDADSPFNARSLEWMEEALSAAPGIAMAWIAMVGFVRLSPRPRILRTPLTITQALSSVDDWLSHPNVHILQPGKRHADLFARLLLAAGTAGNLTNDAHLAALAIEHNVEIGTFDRDFKRFSGLKFQLIA